MQSACFYFVMKPPHTCISCLPTSFVTQHSKCHMHRQFFNTSSQNQMSPLNPSPGCHHTFCVQIRLSSPLYTPLRGHLVFKLLMTKLLLVDSMGEHTFTLFYSWHLQCGGQNFSSKRRLNCFKCGAPKEVSGQFKASIESNLWLNTF